MIYLIVFLWLTPPTDDSYIITGIITYTCMYLYLSVFIIFFAHPSYISDLPSLRILFFAEYILYLF